MATPQVTPNPQTPSASADTSQPQTLAQRIRAKFPGSYDDMDDATLESKVLAKYPQYGDLPRTQVQKMPQNFGTIQAAPTGVLPWLKNLEGDVRYGTQDTMPGKVLHFLGAKGTNIGAQSGAADTVASLPLGAIRMAQGVANPSHPWQATKDLVGGGLQAATIPSAFMGGPGPQQAAGEAAEAARAGIYSKVPFLGKLFASKGAAGQNFQEVMGAAKDAAVPVTDELSGALSRYQQLADAGAQQSLSVRKFINRVTDPNKTPLTYQEARDFYSNISRLSADEAQRLTPVMKAQVGAIRAALNNAIQGTAQAAGKGEQYSSAMAEFADAMRRNQALQSGAEYLAKKLPWLAGAYAANKVIHGH